jgi:polyferredoxin
MIHFRRIVQLAFLGLFCYLLLHPEPAASLIPANLFFITDPLLALSALIASRTFQVVFIASGAIIILSVFLGRVFCGWICPLGATMDIFQKAVRPKSGQANPLSKRLPRIKYFILLAIIIFAGFGVNLAGWFDPITIAFRAYALGLYPALDYILKGLFGAFGLSSFAGSLNNLGILDSNPVLFHNAIIFFTTLVLILLLALYQTRFWCRNLCPLGALLALLGKWRFLNLKISKNLCTECRSCQTACKTGVFNDDFSLNSEECIQCFTCVKKCARNGVTLGLSGVASKEATFLPDRRGLLIASGLSILSAPLFRRSFGLKIGPSLPRLRPPGVSRQMAEGTADSESEFLSKCQRCGACIKACPTNGLQPLLAESGLYAMFSPVLVPRIGHCRYYCNACGQVCPSRAIPPLELAEKQEWKIGLAYVDTARCIPYAHKENCLTCEEFCPAPEKAIGHETRDGIKYPYVIKERCIGCGLCEKICPVQGLAAIRVLPLHDAEL